MAATRYHRTDFGMGPMGLQAGTAAASYTFNTATTNAGWAARFIAENSLDIWSVWINWATVTTPGTFTVRIETDQPGYPSGALYSANAAITTVTPTANWQQVTFASHPTGGLTIGTTYYVVLIIDAGAGTMTLRSSLAQNNSPGLLLTTNSASTRSSFAESAVTPIFSLGMSDGSDYCPLHATPWATVNNTAAQIFGTNAYGMAFTVDNPTTIIGAYLNSVQRAGTPTGNLRGQIFDSTGVLVSGLTCTANLSDITAINNRRCTLPFPATVLQAGTYWLLFDQTDHASTSGNRFTLNTMVARIAGFNASGFTLAKTTDITASPVSITDPSSGLEQPDCGVVLGDVANIGFTGKVTWLVGPNV